MLTDRLLPAPFVRLVDYDTDQSIIDAIDEDTLAVLRGHVSDCENHNVAVGVHRDDTPGVAVTYSIPVDHERAPRPTRDMWWRRDRDEIDTAVLRWTEMLMHMASMKGIALDFGIYDGTSVGLPGWIGVQFFLPFTEAHRVKEFADTVDSMRDVLTRTTSTW